MKKQTKSKPNTLETAFTALKSLDVPVTITAPAKKSEASVLMVPVEGTALAEYIQHDAAEKTAIAGKKLLRPGIEQVALESIYERNVQTPDSPVTTAKLTDASGNAINVSFKDSYKELDRTKALTRLASLGVTNPNPYIQENVAISFDTSIFTDEKGDLRRDLYVAMMDAVAAVALDHNLTASPLSSRKVTTVRPDFHQKRWSIKTPLCASTPAADDVQVQKLLTETFPNTVSLTPQAPVKAKE